MSDFLFQNNNGGSEDHWISISDMMTAIMLIFLLIAISFMIKVSEEKRQIEGVAESYFNLKNELYNDLNNEFKGDLTKWDAEILRDSLIFRYEDVDVMFETGESELTPQFKAILSDFFPRYINLLQQVKYKDEIAEIRIEGHTSSEWEGANSQLEAYLNNMKLSQDRSRKVLAFSIKLKDVLDKQEWLIKYVTANGLSSSKPVPQSKTNPIEDKKRSRRVDFRALLKLEKRIEEISQGGDKN